MEWLKKNRQGKIMKKAVYFFIQILWSFIVSVVVWYLVMKNASFDFYHNSDEALEGMIIFGGMVLYLILTVVYLVIGYKTVKEWRWWVILISIVLSGLMAFLGSIGAVFGSEFLNKTFKLGLFILNCY